MYEKCGNEAPPLMLLLRIIKREVDINQIYNAKLQVTEKVDEGIILLMRWQINHIRIGPGYEKGCSCKLKQFCGGERGNL